jgi:hypothetical protein
MRTKTKQKQIENVQIEKGSSCKRNGCQASFVDSSSKSENLCSYHSGVPIFHEVFFIFSVCLLFFILYLLLFSICFCFVFVICRDQRDGVVVKKEFWNLMNF